jgi:hypothetical protein
MRPRACAVKHGCSCCAALVVRSVSITTACALFWSRCGCIGDQSWALFTKHSCHSLPPSCQFLSPNSLPPSLTNIHTHAHTRAHTQEHCQPHGVHVPVWLHSHQCRHTRAFSLPPLHTHRYTCAHVCVCEFLCENVRMCVYVNVCVRMCEFVCFHACV